MNEALIPYTAPEGVTLVDIRMDSARFPRIKSLAMQSAVGQLERVILTAYTYTGRPAPEDRCRMVAIALYNEIVADKKRIGTGNITVDEVAHAVKSAILNADGDVYINISFLYKAVCAYALGEGHDAQETANRIHTAQRQKALAASTAGTMLEVYTQRTLNNTHTK